MDRFVDEGNIEALYQCVPERDRPLKLYNLMHADVDGCADETYRAALRKFQSLHRDDIIPEWKDLL